MIGVVTKSWERWDIAQMLQSKLDTSAWKGDQHTNGVFFDDKYAVVLNKILAIRVNHCESNSSELFYSFSAVSADGSAEVDDAFPFRNMKVKPKKHFLLFEEDDVEKEDMTSIFEEEYNEGTIRVDHHPIIATLDRVTNKRDRERSVAQLKVEGEKLLVTVQKSLTRGKRKVFSEGTTDCAVITPSTQDTPIGAAVNAHTLSYLLGIFNPIHFSYVTFSFRHDRILITGEKTNQSPNVEVVVSRLKTA